MAEIDAVGLDGTKGGWAVVCLARGAFASSVFNTPPRVVIEALDRDADLTHQDALAMGVAATGSGFSSETWSIAPKILEIHRCRPGEVVGQTGILQ